jgi:hypothetical protein
MTLSATAAPNVKPEYRALLKQLHTTLKPFSEQCFFAKEAFAKFDSSLDKNFFEDCFSLVQHLPPTKELLDLLDLNFPDRVFPYALFNFIKEDWDSKNLKEFLEIRLHLMRETELLKSTNPLIINLIRRNSDTQFVKNLSRYQQKLEQEAESQTVTLAPSSSSIQRAPFTISTTEILYISVGGNKIRCHSKRAEEPIAANELGILRKTMTHGLDNGSLTPQNCLTVLHELKESGLLSNLSEGCFLGLERECSTRAAE